MFLCHKAGLFHKNNLQLKDSVTHAETFSHNLQKEKKNYNHQSYTLIK